MDEIMKVSEIIAQIEALAPLSYQEDFDNSGLQVGLRSDSVTKILVCLDVTEAIIDEAEAKGCEMIVSHHPLIYRPLKQVSDGYYAQRCVYRAIRSGISIYSAHTSLDCSPGGVNYKMASVIGLQNLSWLSPHSDGLSGMGLVGELAEAMSAPDFLSMLKERFAVDCLCHTACSPKEIRKVALCGGSGASFLGRAMQLGADCLVTGEFKYHDYFDSEGMLLVQLGHYQSEQYTIDLLCEHLRAGLEGVEVLKTEINTNAIEYYV